jgi:hypothetical protein
LGVRPGRRPGTRGRIASATAPRPATDLPGELGHDYAAARPDHAPLGGYLTLASVFGVALTGGLVAAPLRGRELPRLGGGDLVLIGVATHKVSRLITKDRVTSFLRAPFTRYQEATGHGEVAEEARGTGLQKALGELLICPYCIALWVAGGFLVGTVHAPRVTRLLAGMWTAHAVADFVQLGYSAAEKRA